MVSSPWKGPQVSDGRTLSRETEGVGQSDGQPSRLLPAAQGTAWPPDVQRSGDQASPAPAIPSGWTRGSSSPCPASGTSGNSWEKWAQANRCYALCNDQRLGSISLPGAALHGPVLGTMRSACRQGRGGTVSPSPSPSAGSRWFRAPSRGPVGTHDQMV